MEKFGFYLLQLPLTDNWFSQLEKSVNFVELGKGRKGNHLTAISHQGIPLVRTTARYQQPAHIFSDLHHRIAAHIQNVVRNDSRMESVDINFNHALIEIYDERYRKMKYHSDQALDLANDSYIALFSCYEHPEIINEQQLRKLRIRDKATHNEFTFTLKQNSVILFSVAINASFSHKIILDQFSNQSEKTITNRWLGITFRQSKTFIHFVDKKPYFSDGQPLQLANEEQQKTFYQLRGQENRSSNFVYPMIDYTLSLGDLLLPCERSSF